MSQQLMAIVADGPKGRTYVAPTTEHEDIAMSATPKWGPEQELADDPRNLWCLPYGLKRFRDLFTARQLTALTTLSDISEKARHQAMVDGALKPYADAIATYIGLLVSRLANTHCSLAVWSQSRDQSVNVFSRQALPMNWDFPEVNPFAGAAGDLTETAQSASRIVAELGYRVAGIVNQLDATADYVGDGRKYLVATDPPYYDNIGYANLSDFFYVWQRQSLKNVWPEIFSTLLVPKVQELIAAPERFEGSRERAQSFFEEAFGRAFLRMRAAHDSNFPLTLFYAFKQSESDGNGEDGLTQERASTGWETMLEGLLKASFQVVGTWPVRSERPSGVKIAVNALASSIVLVCRPRLETAPITTRKDFISALKKELPGALRNLQKGNIAPVDLAQAAIGPGMAVFSKYKRVLETDGSPMRVRTALSLINQGLDEVLSELESEFDPDTRWALAWFEQHQFDEGLYGEAEVLATAKALSINHLADVSILQSRAGRVRLLQRHELPETWDPSNVTRLTVWEVTQHLIRSLDQKGETETASLKAKIGGMAEIARDLAYRLYTLCERKGWAEEAGYYNSLVVSWPSLASGEFELA